VLFTADLKAFSSSGIQVSAPEATIDNVDVSMAMTTENADASAVSLPSLPSLKRTHTEMQQSVGVHDWETILTVVAAAAAAAAAIYAQTLLFAENDDPSSTDDEDLSSANDDASSPRRKRRKESSD